MSNYTLKDVIIDPEDPRLEDAIGKEVYYSDYPNACVRYANDNNRLFIDNLASIHAEDDSPFSVKNCFCTCIIVKKEDPKPGYVPFKSIDEFIESWMCTQEKPETVNVIDCFGIWLRHIIDDEEQPIVQAVEIWNDGLVLGDDCETTRWEELLENYQFLNGTPCGKRY